MRGLFEINNTAFMLFKVIELIVRKHLFTTFEQGSSVDSGQHEIITAVANNECAVLLDYAISGY